jgi:hypothetical protein
MASKEKEKEEEAVKPSDVVVEIKEMLNTKMPEAVEQLFATICKRATRRFTNIVAVRRPCIAHEGRQSEALELLSIKGDKRLRIEWVADPANLALCAFYRMTSGHPMIDCAWSLAGTKVENVNIFLSVVHVWFGMPQAPAKR